jgi:hypothetical protein
VDVSTPPPEKGITMTNRDDKETARPPGAEAMKNYCQEIPRLLQGWGVEVGVAEAIGSDILMRGQAFAALDHAAQKALAAPFVENAVNHEPVELSVDLRAAATVVVRNSRLEEAHASGPVKEGGIRGLTTLGAHVLAQFLHAGPHHRSPWRTDPFAHLPETFPRAWAALSTLSTALSSDGGRVSYRAPHAPVPSWPDASEIVPARQSEQHPGSVVQSAVDTALNEQLVNTMRAVIDHKILLYVPSLSRVSRNMDVLLYVIEMLLAHGAPILTTNYLIRTNDVWVRQGQLVPPPMSTSAKPTSGVENLTGLSGSHRKVVQNFLREDNASS